MKIRLPIEVAAQEIYTVQSMVAGESHVVHIYQLGYAGVLNVSATGKQSEHALVEAPQINRRIFSVDNNRHHPKPAAVQKKRNERTKALAKPNVMKVRVLAVPTDVHPAQLIEVSGLIKSPLQFSGFPASQLLRQLLGSLMAKYAQIAFNLIIVSLGDKQVADLIYMVIGVAPTCIRPQVSELVWVPEGRQHRLKRIPVIGDNPVLLQPGFSFPGFTRKIIIVIQFLIPTQGKHTPNAVSIFGHNEVRPMPVLIVKAAPDLPPVRDQLGWNQRLPQLAAFTQVAGCPNSHRDYRLRLI
jgi:hypothetical protein